MNRDYVINVGAHRYYVYVIVVLEGLSVITIPALQRGQLSFDNPNVTILKLFYTIVSYSTDWYKAE